VKKVISDGKNFIFISFSKKEEKSEVVLQFLYNLEEFSFLGGVKIVPALPFLSLFNYRSNLYITTNLGTKKYLLLTGGRLPDFAR
jgi:hypothetical protein